MKFQVGDKVIVLHSDEEGEVVDIINNKMVLVDVRGVKFPAYIDQLDFPYFKRFTEKKLFPKKEKQYIDDVRKEKAGKSEKVQDGVWLVFLPVIEPDEFGDEVVVELKLHLINRTDRGYHFNYNLNFFGKRDFDLKNDIYAFQDFYLHDIPFADMSDSPVFEFEFSLLQPDKKKAEYHQASVKLKPKQLFAKVEEIRKKNESTFSFRLFEIYPEKTVPEKVEPGKFGANKISPYDASGARRHLEPAKAVIDLHIEKLADNWKDLNNYEILDLQLKTFEKYFELAYLHHQPNLIVVHGMGSGRLRDEIHDILRLKKEVKSFVNQYHPSFGYGATEIYFQY